MDFDVVLAADGLADGAEDIDEFLLVPRFDVVKFFVFNEVADLLLIGLGDAAHNEAAEHADHFLFRKGPAVEKNFANC